MASALSNTMTQAVRPKSVTYTKKKIQIRLVQQYLQSLVEKPLQLRQLIFYLLFPSNLSFLMSVQRKKTNVISIPFNVSIILNIETTLFH